MAASTQGKVRCPRDRQYGRQRQQYRPGACALSLKNPPPAGFHAAEASAKLSGNSPFDRFVVDFYCRAKPVIEFDSKRNERFSGCNAGLTKTLERLGLRIVRFTSAEVSDDLDSVLERIHAELGPPFD